jgi:hypothetical protein
MLLDLRGPIPSVIGVTHGWVHANVMLTELVPEPGAIYIMDRGYVDFAPLPLHRCRCVVRAKTNLRVARVYSHPVDRITGLRSDHKVRLTGHVSRAGYPAHLCRVRFHDAEHARAFVFLTNAFALPALTIHALYKRRWQIELFFKAGCPCPCGGSIPVRAVVSGSRGTMSHGATWSVVAPVAQPTMPSVSRRFIRTSAREL